MRLAMDCATYRRIRSYRQVFWGAVQPHNNFWGLHTNPDVFASRVRPAQPPLPFVTFHVSVSRFTIK